MSEYKKCGECEYVRYFPKEMCTFESEKYDCIYESELETLEYLNNKIAHESVVNLLLLNILTTEQANKYHMRIDNKIKK